MTARFTTANAAAVLLAGSLLASCSSDGDQQENPEPSETDPGQPAVSSQTGGQESEGPLKSPQESTEPENTAPENTEVVLVTPESFALPEDELAEFEATSGYDLTLRAEAELSAATLTGADAVAGVATLNADTLTRAELFTPYRAAKLPRSARKLKPPEPSSAYLSAVGYNDICVNVDTFWFANRGLNPPQSLRDLTQNTYQDLFAMPGPDTREGMGFLYAAVGEFGPGEWLGYMEDLLANGAKVTDTWDEAYSQEFTASADGGDRPVVVGYASSPASTVAEGAWQPAASAVADTCFREVSYAGVQAEASNVEGAQALVDWLVTEPVQSAMPESMNLYPVADVGLPDAWVNWTPPAEDPIPVHPGQIAELREEWRQQWAELLSHKG